MTGMLLHIVLLCAAQVMLRAQNTEETMLCVMKVA